MRHTSCDSTQLCTYPRAYLASVNYPNQYFYEGSSCTWSIITERNTFIVMRFLTFDVPSWDECLSSVVSIHDGDTDKDVVIGLFCNVIPPPEHIQSGFNMAVIKFRFSTGNPGNGFLMEYNAEVFYPAKGADNLTGKYNYHAADMYCRREVEQFNKNNQKCQVRVNFHTRLRITTRNTSK